MRAERCPSRSWRSSKLTPAARKRLPNVCLRSCTRTCGSPAFSLARFHAVLGMADIRKRKGKRPYQVRFAAKSNASGYGYKSFLKWQDAIEFNSQKELEEDHGLQPTSVKTVEDAIDKWLKISKTEGRKNPGEPVSPATLEQYEYRSRIMTGR